jgi:probable rRNA maturation factor
MSAEVRVEIQIAGDATGLPGDDEIRHWLEQTINAVAPDEERSVELVVRVVGEQESRELNSRFRHQDTATNVLAFPAAPVGDFPGVTPEPGEELGDLVLCGTVIAREAREQDKDIAAHWGHMLVHGTLHLLGYEHGTDKEAARMERLESRILAGRGFDDPYATR